MHEIHYVITSHLKLPDMTSRRCSCESTTSTLVSSESEETKNVTPEDPKASLESQGSSVTLSADLTKAAPPKADLAVSEDPNRVTWDGPNDPEDPQNWSYLRRWGITLICLLMAVNV